MNQKLSNYFNMGLSLYLLLDLILITFTLVFKIENNLYYIIIAIDTILCVILIYEFYNRFKTAENKIHFSIRNSTEILAGIPIDLIFLPFAPNLTVFLTIFNLLKFLKIIGLFLEFFETIDVFLKKTHLDEILGLAILVILVSTLGIYLFDPSINSIFDSLWFVLSTITTVGYGDVLPNSYIGKVIGILILIFGVLIFSAITGAMTSYFARKVFATKDFNITENDDNIRLLKEDLSFNKKNLNNANEKIDKINNDVEKLKRELNEMKEELRESRQLNKELKEEIVILNENLKNK
ncbi:ion transport protein [Methanobrevibacter ruminantium M1]|uniref:Ion transport protein n=1 Tax=Methanobrevibacter ruminantium (strain ATCC 35063 / DSM 1093 / JCM 13430 / OCM 146 / M1) TaxID=634498 RepID=D3E323_METRM|nr:potassium channel family protein [Methanobrevibacter ruminantium]ADC46934.1 ion transport protein [Methanobrevibacter ruminantium M1]